MVDLETWEVEGTAPVQSWELVAESTTGPRGWCGMGWWVPVSRGVCVLVVEHFRLRTQNVDLDPVLVMGGVTTLLVPRVAGVAGALGTSGVAGLVGGGAYALGATVAFQQPADAMRFATNDRAEGVGPGPRALVWGVGEATVRAPARCAAASLLQVGC